MKKVIKYFSIILAIIIAAHVIPSITLSAIDSMSQQRINAGANGAQTVDPTVTTNTYDSLEDLFKGLGYSYEGSGSDIVLTNGLNYTTGYSHNYINVFIWTKDGDLVGDYKILHM